MTRTFEELVAEAVAVPIVGWDFSWLEGRATEERPSWRYSERMAERAVAATRMLDLECGGGELLAGLPRIPPLLESGQVTLTSNRTPVRPIRLPLTFAR